MNPDYKHNSCCKQNVETYNSRIRDKSDCVFLLTTVANYEIVKKAIELLKMSEINEIFALAELLVKLGFESEYKMIINADFDLNK